MEGEGSYICLHTLIFEFSAHTIEDYTVESRPRSGISTCINRSSICQLAWHFLSCVTCQSYQQWFCMWWMSYLWFFSPENVVMLWCIKTKAKSHNNLILVCESIYTESTGHAHVWLSHTLRQTGFTEAGTKNMAYAIVLDTLFFFPLFPRSWKQSKEQWLITCLGRCLRGKGLEFMSSSLVLRIFFLYYLYWIIMDQ